MLTFVAIVTLALTPSAGGQQPTPDTTPHAEHFLDTNGARLQPEPGTPFAQVQEWWTVYRPDFAAIKAPMLMLYAIQEQPPLPANAPADLRTRAEAFWRDTWLPFNRSMIDDIRRTTPTAHVVVFENTSHYLFRDREADVIREMMTFYDRFKK